MSHASGTAQSRSASPTTEALSGFSERPRDSARARHEPPATGSYRARAASRATAGGGFDWSNCASRRNSASLS
jgi:hypothetical protein